MIKIQHISDTHSLHEQIEIELDSDFLLHTGDETNHYNILYNQKEFDIFYDWWSKIPIKNKVLIAGNHSAALTLPYNKDKLKECCTYLEHEYAKIDGISFFGSPYTPTYGNWHFMKARNTLGRVWEHLSYVDVLLTHGPPKGILDLAYHGDCLERCGDGALLKKVMAIKPKLHCFGHLHTNKDNINGATMTVENIIFSNGSVVKDGEIMKVVNKKGNIIII